MCLLADSPVGRAARGARVAGRASRCADQRLGKGKERSALAVAQDKFHAARVVKRCKAAIAQGDLYV